MLRSIRTLSFPAIFFFQVLPVVLHRYIPGERSCKSPNDGSIGQEITLRSQLAQILRDQPGQAGAIFTGVLFGPFQYVGWYTNGQFSLLHNTPPVLHNVAVFCTAVKAAKTLHLSCVVGALGGGTDLSRRPRDGVWGLWKQVATEVKRRLGV